MEQTPVQESISAPARRAISQPHRWRIIGSVVFAAALVALFIRPLLELLVFAYKTEHNGHILLVPVITAYLISQKRGELQIAGNGSILGGIIGLVVGLIVAGLALSHPLVIQGDRLAALTFSFLSIAAGGCFFFLGRELLSKIAFPIAFLIFMVPLPSGVLTVVETALQYASAEASHWMLNLTNVPFLRTGLDFQMPGISIRVAQECSGFNSTWVLFMVSLLTGHMFLAKTSKKVLLVAFVLPLAILRNAFRITTISMLCVYIDPKMINSAIHRHGGPVFFALSLIPFCLFAWWLIRSEQKTVKLPPQPDAK